MRVIDRGEVREQGKTLYHIQSTDAGLNPSYDIFIFADHEPNDDEVREIYIADTGLRAEDVKDEADNFVDNYEVYRVYASELEGRLDG